MNRCEIICFNDFLQRTMMEIHLPEIANGEDKSSILGNRIKNNYRHVRKWAKRTQTNCFRLYDREIHHYPLAIDFYAGRFCVQYFSTSRDKIDPPTELIEEINHLLSAIFAIPEEMIFWRIRSKQKETRQYEKRAETRQFFTAIEYGVKFKINLLDYLDTGLFLDHRETRRLVASYSKGKSLLNLFAYTCSFSVQAAVAGAIFTKSVDLSNTYTDWGIDNFLLNSISIQNHPVIRDDCLKFLESEIRSKRQYDLIVIDPPTISRSKKMDQLFDIQVDYVTLISKASALLLKDGLIFFSTNSRKFHLDEGCFPALIFEEISHKTHPIDFHDPKIHRCWKISKLQH